MSSDRRKNNFKSTGSVESRVDRSIKEKSSESKSKRDAALAAKRMRLVDSADDILPDPSSYTVRDAVVKIQVLSLFSSLLASQLLTGSFCRVTI